MRKEDFIFPYPCKSLPTFNGFPQTCSHRFASTCPRTERLHYNPAQTIHVGCSPSHVLPTSIMPMPGFISPYLYSMFFPLPTSYKLQKARMSAMMVARRYRLFHWLSQQHANSCAAGEPFVIGTDWFMAVSTVSRVSLPLGSKCDKLYR